MIDFPLVSQKETLLIAWLDWCLLTEEEIDNCQIVESGVYQIALGNNNFIKYPKGTSSVIYIGSAHEGELKNRLKEHIRGDGNLSIYEYCMQKHKLFWRAAPNFTEQDALDDFTHQFGDLPKANIDSN